MFNSLTDPHNHLIAATVLLVVAIIVPRVRRHWPLWAWVSWRAMVLVVLTVLLLGLLGSPLEPRFVPGPPDLKLWQQFIEASWWVVAARALVGFARLFVVLEDRPRETRIVSDLLAGAIYIATGLAVVNFAFHVPIGGLLATSGVIAIVLGLALQSTLSDVFSGIAVGLERPYQAGDLIWVEGGIEGRVVEVNWRSTHIATLHHNIAIVPNSIIAKSRLINRSAPTPLRADSILISIDAAAIPENCVVALKAAARACLIPAAKPAPTVACAGLQGDGVVYEISFSVESSDQLSKARAELFMQVHRHLRHAGIALAVATMAAPPKIEAPSLGRLLEQSELFSVLEAADRQVLAEHFTLRVLDENEFLIREGETPESLFIIASGTAEITKLRESGPPRVIYRLTPGETLGAVGLMTGSPYLVSAKALTPMKTYRLSKAAMTDAVKLKPEFSKAFASLAERGQAILSRSEALANEALAPKQDTFLPRLRNILRLLAS
jgi:small-conductance mechanosensitive channel/CRP-like cAMP-binding protein